MQHKEMQHKEMQHEERAHDNNNNDFSSENAKFQERVAWNFMDLYFSPPANRLTQHQIDSFNDYMENHIPLILTQYDPVQIFHNFDEESNKFTTEIKIYFSNVSYVRPVIQENNGSTKPMTPASARLRGLTYSAGIFADILFELYLYSGADLQEVETQVKKFKHIELGKIPIMLRSNFCMLSSTMTPSAINALGESNLEQGGYFIINGSEKVVISQERQAENRIYCFKTTKSRCSHVVEIKSVSHLKLLPAKPLSVKMTTRSGSQGQLILVSCLHFRQELPVAILFRALGAESDKEILQHVFGDIDSKDAKDFFHLLRPSLLEAGDIRTREDALLYLSKHVIMMGFPKEIKVDDSKRVQMVEEILVNDLLPHLGVSLPKKLFFLGFMTRRLLLYFLGFCEEDDRDAYSKKRVDTPGILLANLTRQYITKMIKEIRNGMMKEMNTGNWRYTKSIDDLVNAANIYKILKSTTLDSGLKFCLSTGNWGLKNFNVKVGVAQVVNRLSYNAMISHLRRLNTPIDKTSKLTQPRKLHSTCWGYVCPSETPEGGSIGGVKNMAMTCEITLNIDTAPIYRILEHLATGNTEEVEALSEGRRGKGGREEQEDGHEQKRLFELFHPFPPVKKVVVFVNGDVAGFTETPYKLVDLLREYRRKGVVHMHTSITFVPSCKEIFILCDAGRVTRPLLRVENGCILVTENILERIETSFSDSFSQQFENDDPPITFQSLLRLGIVEYLDALESEGAMICSSVSELRRIHTSQQFGGIHEDSKRVHRRPRVFTHCELHPSLIFGAMAMTIPFSNHNQSPRNTYQSAMSKQSMGLYASNYLNRMDTMCHVLSYPMLPLVSTAMSSYTFQERSPNGCNVIVAIMCYSGFNQEDSVLINQSAVERGLFSSTFYRTYKDEEKRNQLSGEDEKFQKPVLAETREMKSGSYEHLDPETGVPVLESFVDGGDVIIGKIVPVKQIFGNNVATTGKPFRDQSTTLRYSENGKIDKVYSSFNAEGNPFLKVRVRSTREPEIGDKFSSRHGQKGTCGGLFHSEDMPFPMSGEPPDIIINPHAIPSRMTIAQIVELVMGKLCCASGRFGDGTPFTTLNPTDLGRVLSEKFGLQRHGNEIFYNGMTGEQMECEVFSGPTYYQRLKHLSADKIHSRSRGPCVMLTRQPAEGRARDGGLRFGEMERDCMLGSGSLQFLKERMHDLSDSFKMYVSRSSGLISAVNREKGIYNSFDATNKESDSVCIPYNMKLLSQELQGMSIATRFEVEKI